MPHPLLFPFMGNFKETSYGINIIRIRGAILRGLGHNKNDFNVALPLIEYVDKIMQKDLMDDYYNKDAKYMYHEPADVVLMFIAGFNQCYTNYIFYKWKQLTSKVRRHKNKVILCKHTYSGDEPIDKEQITRMRYDVICVPIDKHSILRAMASLRLFSWFAQKRFMDLFDVYDVETERQISYTRCVHEPE